MENIIWGIDFNIQDYGMREIYSYLLIVELIVLVTGRYAEKQKKENQYLILIRCRTERKWWRGQCIKMALLAAALVAVLFAGYILECLFEKRTVSCMLAYPFVMWYAAILALGMLQKAVSETNNGSKWAFLAATVTELISLYSQTLGLNKQLAKWLPGNYLMYMRYEDGFQEPALKIVLAAEMTVSLIVCFKWNFRRKK